MSQHLDTAKSQAAHIGGAINGSSSAMQTLGNIGGDPHPEKILAVAAAHSQNALDALIQAVEDLEREVAMLRRRR